MKKYESITIFLNRACPRGCPQCGISDASRNPLNVGQWIDIFKILAKEFETKFYLFLGTETLIFRQELVEMVQWFTDNNLFYGFYSTSPEPMFTKYRQQLVDAGLQNWSSGIDSLPKMSLDLLSGKKESITDKKVRESIGGLIWMAERGVQAHTLTTIHKKNLHQVVDILEWCQENIVNVQSSCNFIEWKRGPEFDFFSKRENMEDLCWDGSPEEEREVRKVMRQIKLFSRVHGKIIQTPDSYLDNAHKHYTTLAQHCGGSIGPAVDCDGTLRLCGYSTGYLAGNWNVLDLPGRMDEFMKDWNDDLNACTGCHWIFPDMLREDNARILDPKSGFHQERWNISMDQYKMQKETV